MDIYQDKEGAVYVLELETIIIQIELYGARRKDTTVFLYTKNEHRIKNYKTHVAMGYLFETKMSKIFDAIFDAEKLTTFGVGG